jgi:hypothetical protein
VTLELPDAALGVSAREELYDASGRSVRTETLRGREAITIESNALPAGIYLLAALHGSAGSGYGAIGFLVMTVVCSQRLFA